MPQKVKNLLLNDVINARELLENMPGVHIYKNSIKPFYIEYKLLIAPHPKQYEFFTGSKYGIYIEFTKDIVNNDMLLPNFTIFRTEADYKNFKRQLPEHIQDIEYKSPDCLFLNR